MDSDISAYTVERTLVMEQRNQMLRELQLNKKESQGLVPTLVEFNEVQAVVDHHHSVDVKTATKVRFQEPNSQQPNGIEESQDKSATQENPASKEGDAVESNEKSEDAADNKAVGSPKPDVKEKSDKETKENDTSGSATKKPIAPDQDDVRRMHTAVKLNEIIVNKSHDAQLVILNLPGPPKDTRIEREANYMEFLEVLTESLEKVLMVHGAGREVITMYS
ncbi:hypothetical protein KQX54_020723 [Cotesia glomerata]|uniref:SLC12A transporter C-terminal domain-containing protein n=2 Tax=Cotesia glomerata TaxID=32391 RepID=A0AAV7J8R7_COTGL|nr:hypothetical protein KQX54_020723 [Cotesia glomerata]